MERPYKSPWYPVLPIVVAGMSLFAAVLCVWYPSAELESHNWFSDYVVLWLTLAMYGIGLLYYFGFARTRLVHAAPEELAAREAN
jgi:amino acid permease